MWSRLKDLSAAGSDRSVAIAALLLAGLVVGLCAIFAAVSGTGTEGAVVMAATYVVSSGVVVGLRRISSGAAATEMPVQLASAVAPVPVVALVFSVPVLQVAAGIVAMYIVAAVVGAVLGVVKASLAPLA